MKKQYIVSFLLVSVAAISLAAGYTFWHARPDGPAALVVTPRQYIGLMPAVTNSFSARMYHNNGADSDVSTNGTVWTCAPAIGTIVGCSLIATNAAPFYGWVQATCSGLATRVYVKVSADGTWNPDADFDGDGLSDAAEIASNTSPAAITLLDVRAKLSQAQR